MEGRSQRSDPQPLALAVESYVLTRVEYAVLPLVEGSFAVHYRVRRLFLWGRWEALRDPQFFSSDAARRYLGEMLRGRRVAISDPLVKEAYEGS